MTDLSSLPAAPPASAGKTTRPRPRVRVPLLAAGLGLVLASTVLVVWGFSRASDRAEVLMITADVEAGTPIPVDALSTTMIGVDDGVGQFYPAGTDLSGAVAAVDLSPGDVLSPAVLKAAPTVPADSREVGAVVRAGRYPSTVDVGDEMVAVSTEADGEVTVFIVSAETGEDGALSTVLAAPAADATRVAQWAAADSLALVRVP